MGFGIRDWEWKWECRLHSNSFHRILIGFLPNTKFKQKLTFFRCFPIVGNKEQMFSLPSFRVFPRPSFETFFSSKRMTELNDKVFPSSPFKMHEQRYLRAAENE